MLKKILTIAALLAVIGLLVWGGIIRTQAKVTDESQSTGLGGETVTDLTTTTGQNDNTASGPEDHAVSLHI